MSTEIRITLGSMLIERIEKDGLWILKIIIQQLVLSMFLKYLLDFRELIVSEDILVTGGKGDETQWRSGLDS